MCLCVRACMRACVRACLCVCVYVENRRHHTLLRFGMQILDILEVEDNIPDDLRRSACSKCKSIDKITKPYVIKNK